MRRILLKRGRRRLGTSQFRRAVDINSSSPATCHTVLSSSNHASRLLVGSQRKYGGTNYESGGWNENGRSRHQAREFSTRTTTAALPNSEDENHNHTKQFSFNISSSLSTPLTTNFFHSYHQPRFQLQQRRNFHATKKEEVLPYIIVGAGVTYYFAKWVLDYRAAKESGSLDDDEEVEDIDEDGNVVGKKKRVVINAAGVAGLDLGSVYSRVGVALEEEKDDKADSDDDYDSDEDDGTPKNWYTRVVENAEGSRSTVSLVGLQPGEDEFVVGDKAKNLIGKNFWASHRLLGLKYGDTNTSTFVEHFKIENQLIPGIGGTMQIQIDDSTEAKASPEMLTSRVIQHLTTLADGYIPSGKCSHVLIAVPDDVVDNEIACNSFDISMRQAGVQSLGVEKQSICAIHGKFLCKKNSTTTTILLL
jgi:hypothetical protein